MTFEFSIEMTGLDIVDAELRAKMDALDDFTVPLKRCAVSYYNTVQMFFDESKGPDGIAWAPLTPAYARRKPKGNTKILILEGTLQDTIVTGTTSTIDREKLSVGSNMPYAAAHQFGYKKGGIPKRTFLGFTEEDEEIFVEIFADWVDEAGK